MQENQTSSNNLSPKNWVPLVVIVIAVVAGLIGYAALRDLTSGSASDELKNVGIEATNTQEIPLNINANSPMAESEIINNNQPAVETKIFDVTGKNFLFAPSTLTVNQGDKVKIIFRNEEGFHDFKIDELNIATSKITAGTQDTIEFIADKKGQFDYYCSVGTHRGMGMKGILVVQ